MNLALRPLAEGEIKAKSMSRRVDYRQNTSRDVLLKLFFPPEMNTKQTRADGRESSKSGAESVGSG